MTTRGKGSDDFTNLLRVFHVYEFIFVKVGVSSDHRGAAFQDNEEGFTLVAIAFAGNFFTGFVATFLGGLHYQRAFVRGHTFEDLDGVNELLVARLSPAGGELFAEFDFVHLLGVVTHHGVAIGGEIARGRRESVLVDIFLLRWC